ncbi:MAG: hypothetical protein D6726_08990 [Nitrospirae bacterium]|nr:MAG: hypothetical protein D6726_08990 [Nitrospirota bacterium]
MLVSRNVAIWLLTLVTLILAIGAFLPNPELLTDSQRVDLQSRHPLIYYLGERYNSEKVAKGYFFGFIGIFLIISTTMCSLDRLFKWRKTRARSGEMPVMPGQRKGREIAVDMLNRDNIYNRSLDWFKRKRMRVYRDKDLVVGYRGEAGFWGSIFFHAILITALFGLVIYYLGGYRASFNITEGQTLHLKKESFFYIEKEPLWGLRPPDIALKLLSVYTTYAPQDPWTAIDHVVKFEVNDLETGETSMQTMKINKPLIYRGVDFLLQSGGFSPRVMISKGGGVIFDKFVSLKNEGGRADDFPFNGMHISITFFPDYIERDGRHDTRTPQIKNPFFLVAVNTANDSKTELIPLGGTISIEEYKIHIPDIRRWVIIQMVGEPGIGFFFVISFAGLIGVFVRFIDPDERIYLRFKGEGVLEIIPYSKYFSGLIEERVSDLSEYILSEKG